VILTRSPPTGLVPCGELIPLHFVIMCIMHDVCLFLSWNK
jgi:hypothetical protein